VEVNRLLAKLEWASYLRRSNRGLEVYLLPWEVTGAGWGNINLPETQKVGLSERDDGGSEARAPFGGYENRLKLSNCVSCPEGSGGGSLTQRPFLGGSVLHRAHSLHP
jgi:hypothetical protein